MSSCTRISSLQKFSTYDIVKLSDSIIKKLIEDHRRLKRTTKYQKNEDAKIFDAELSAKMTLVNFIYKLVKSLEIEKEAVLYSLILIDLCLVDNEDIKITEKNKHLLFLTSLLISSKMLGDVRYREADIAEVIGINQKYLAYMEEVFLKSINYKTFISYEFYTEYTDAFTSLL